MTRTLQSRLSLWLACATLGLALLAGSASFGIAFLHADAWQDDLLLQVAQLVERQALQPGLAAPVLPMPHGEDETQVFVQWLEGEHLPAHLALPAGLRDGTHTVTLQDEPFRLLIHTLPDGRRFAVAQETAVRDSIARTSALSAIVPLLILVPVLLLVIARLVGHTLQPVTLLARDLDQRVDDDLRALPTDTLAGEIQPFVKAINRMFRRVQDGMEDQRRFVADAAHELRTPLAALTLQAERLDALALDVEARQRLQALRSGIARATGTVSQLLTLARLQANAPAQANSVASQTLFRTVIETLLPLAEARQQDLGLLPSQAVILELDVDALHTILANLVDNAIRYSPPGARIDLALTRHDGAPAGWVVHVRDTGPGIPRAERDRVFQPFYRGTADHSTRGAGLGLAIVQTCVERLGARIELDACDREHQRGLHVQIWLPAACAHAVTPGAHDTDQRP